MATTFVPDPRELRTDVDLKEFLDTVHEQLKISQGDEDKSGSIDDAAYYEGWADALTWIEDQITVPHPDKCEICGNYPRGSETKDTMKHYREDCFK
jgi:hypothetical protein